MCTAHAGVLTAVASMGSQALQIKANNRALAAQAQSIVTGAVKQGRADIRMLNLRQTQTADAITLDQVRRYSQGRRERGTLVARVADAGVSGASSIRDVVASVIQEDMDIGTMEAQKKATIGQLNMEKLGVKAQVESQVNKARSLVNQQTTGLSSVLGIISAGVSGYATGKQLEPG